MKFNDAMKDNKGFKISQYACAVLLIVSSIALVTYQVVHIDDVAGGLLYYVAQPARSCPVPALGRFPPSSRPHRPIAHRLQLASHLLEPLCPASPLRPPRILQINQVII